MLKNIGDLNEETMGKIGSGNSFKNENVINWKNWLNEYRFLPGHPDEPYAWLSVVLAIKSIDSGNYHP